MVLHQDGLENNEIGDIRKIKIVRPDDQKFLEDPNAIKGIRGRRRVLCPVRVAPISKFVINYLQIVILLYRYDINITITINSNNRFNIYGLVLFIAQCSDRFNGL
jgi:hypothetical protein